MKKIFTLIALMLATSSIASAYTWKGSGTQSDPYLIENAQQLDEIRTLPENKDANNYFKLTVDIDLATWGEWRPLNDAPYNRVIHLDGNGYVISNLTSVNLDDVNPDLSNAKRQYSGLFGTVVGSVKNLGVINANVKSIGRAGILGGYVGVNNSGDGVVENCYITGKIEGTRTTGGIGGLISTANSYIKNCHANVEVTLISGGSSGFAVGGIVAQQNVDNQVVNCVAEGTVTTVAEQAGGIIGLGNAVSCVALNTSVNSNTGTGKVGRVSGELKSAAQTSYAISSMKLTNGSTAVTPGSNTAAGGSYDGTAKTAAELATAATYATLFGDAWGTIWSDKLVDGKPALAWYAKRQQSSSNEPITVDDVKVSLTNGLVNVTGADVKNITIYNISGTVCKNVNNTNQTELNAGQGIYIIKLETANGTSVHKVVNK